MSSAKGVMLLCIYIVHLMIYSGIQIFRRNEGSFGEITQDNKDEILTLLNQQKYTLRNVISIEFSTSVLSEILCEIENEVNERISQGKLTPGCHYEYYDNCHTLARKVKEKLGWEIISGYTLMKKDVGKSKIKLRAHSIIKDQSGTLIELTTTWTPESTLFIEHHSGELGFDLEAY